MIPTAAAAVTHRPLPPAGARITTGLLADWQRRNATASLPLALRQLEVAGNLANLRLAIAGAHEGYQGPVFMDSDLYKTLEAIGWELARTGDATTAGADDLVSFVSEATLLLEKAQQPDGYLNSYVQVSGKPRYAALASSHELYCAGHLIQAAVALHRAGGPPCWTWPGGSPITWWTRSWARTAGSMATRSWRRRWSSCTGRPGTGPTWSWPASSSKSAATG